MWQKQIKKTIFTLDIDDYAPEVTELTYPFLYGYADKIGANVHIINERKFPQFNPVYEKMQIYNLAQEMQNDWNIYIDCDALIHPDMIDLTNHMTKDTVGHHATDLADLRWKFDRFFYRDGRFIGSCNWMAIASDWCIELWRPLDDLTPEEASANIYPITTELKAGIDPPRLIDDYVLSRNIAKYGFKFISFSEIFDKLGFISGNFLYHQYAMSSEEKAVRIKQILIQWGLI
jgi:hypothetical protein